MRNNKVRTFLKNSLQRRSVVLLEVLIAFALVALCVLPLIYPHVFILKSEKAFVDIIQLDHSVNLLFANRLEKLYQNKIPWNDIEDKKEIPIDSTMLQESGIKETLPFTGTYRFFEVKHKPQKLTEKTEKSVYYYKLIFTFLPKKELFKQKGSKPFVYEYDIVIERRYK